MATTTKKIPEGMHDVKEHMVKAHTAKNPDDHDPKTVEGTHKVKAHNVVEHLAHNPGTAAAEKSAPKAAAAKPAAASSEGGCKTCGSKSGTRRKTRGKGTKGGQAQRTSIRK